MKSSGGGAGMAKRVRAQGVVDPRKAVGYVRVSTDDQGLSVEAQVAALQEWCLAKGVVLVKTEVDRGVSGACPVKDRPGLMAALAGLGENGAGVFLALRRDRIARDTLVAAQVDRIVRSERATVRTVHGDFEVDTPETRLMKTMADAFAEYELAMISLRTKMALRAKKARGEVTGQPEFGYRSVKAAGGVARMEPDEREQACLAAIKEYSLQGLPFGVLAAKLFANGHLPRGGGSWTPELIKRRKMQLGVHPSQLAEVAAKKAAEVGNV